MASSPSPPTFRDRLGDLDAPDEPADAESRLDVADDLAAAEVPDLSDIFLYAIASPSQITRILAEGQILIKHAPKDDQKWKYKRQNISFSNEKNQNKEDFVRAADQDAIKFIPGSTHPLLN